MTSWLKFISIALLCASALAVPTPAKDIEIQPRRIDLANRYAPRATTCPSGSLVRPATSINPDEAAYIAARKPVASAALSSWLKRQGNFSTSSNPAVGLTSSGGGYRALLCTAGVIQGFDIRDSDLNTSGVYQGLTYESGLSGGSWFLSSLAGNNWPTVTYLKTSLWQSAFQDSALLPANLLSISDDTEYVAVATDLAAKQAAGYKTTIVDPYGRLLSYQLLEGTDGGVATRLSGLTALSNFTCHNVPYPIITTIGVKGYQGQCIPSLNATQYEFHPYEYGSWDSGVSAFANTQYMGSAFSNGQPSDTTCTVHYDNLGYVFGTSSDVFFAACEELQPSNSSSADLENVLERLASIAHEPTFEDLFGVYPNPFYNYSRSTMVSADPLLTMVDGGSTDQNNPIWPFIQPERSVDVLIVNDNSADTTDNYPDGTEIRQTYLNAQAAGLTKMPYIPDVSTFVSEGLNKRATFFGCNETGTTFIVFLPNVDYTYDSGQSTSKVEYTVAETDAMIANGVQIANQNGTAGWSFCLACAIRNQDGTALPTGCNACFDRYCYYK
ncbi:Lysophospholipase 2 [Teratosphaeria destructans]|uniref:Lysophospholipase n=1 Tax=Teratosphaeria destructans TaxID=418781 RepID=A0A9W7SNW9_9PEZI|nr:Lysophospholipase 2 [Teratosphaeria destructans]